jgi:hypothetical protein
MKIEGPIPTDGSAPFGTATASHEKAELMKEFGYVEEEFFISGNANVYGPESSRPLQAGEGTLALRPLSTVRHPDIPYKTRALVIRPRDVRVFSGIVHAIPFHNLLAQATVERNLLRHGDAWVGIEVCSGTRFGPQEIPSGGVANLWKVNQDRYGGLTVVGGEPSDWGQLTPGALGEAFGTLNFGKAGPEMEVFTQELYRSYAQGPDIFFDVVHGLRSEDETVLQGFQVRRVFTSGASGATLILRPLADYHHNEHMISGDQPAIDGYFIMVGNVPNTRPRGAIVAVLQSEAEAMRQVAEGTQLPEDTDDPGFRSYELPGAGHMISAAPDSLVENGSHGDVLPPGIQGLNERGSSEEYDPYDKFNAPIVWALWDAMYRWADDGLPMPHAERITRDPGSPDGVARDVHGNALGGIRTPWVDVPDGRYVARISEANPLRAGIKRFSESRMKELYGSRQAYLDKVGAKLDEMIQQRFLLPDDKALMIRCIT